MSPIRVVSPRWAMLLVTSLLISTAANCESCSGRCGQVNAYPSYGCNCDQFCPTVGDCCLDFETQCPETNRTSYTLPSSAVSNMGTIISSASLIMSCPGNDTLARLCALDSDSINSRQMESILLLAADIYHRQYRVVFRNIYCAMCLQVYDIENFEFSELFIPRYQFQTFATVRYRENFLIESVFNPSGSAYEHRLKPKLYPRIFKPTCPNVDMASIMGQTPKMNCSRPPVDARYEPVVLSYNGSIDRSCFFRNAEEGLCFLEGVRRYRPDESQLFKIEEFSIQEYSVSVRAQLSATHRDLQAWQYSRLLQIDSRRGVVRVDGDEYLPLCGAPDVPHIFHCQHVSHASSIAVRLAPAAALMLLR